MTFLSACSQFCVVMQRKVFDIMQDFIFQFAIKYFINLQKKCRSRNSLGVKWLSNAEMSARCLRLHSWASGFAGSYLSPLSVETCLGPTTASLILNHI